MEGVETKELLVKLDEYQPPKTIPVMEGVETSSGINDAVFFISEDYPRYGGG